MFDLSLIPPSSFVTPPLALPAPRKRTKWDRFNHGDQVLAITGGMRFLGFVTERTVVHTGIVDRPYHLIGVMNHTGRTVHCLPEELVSTKRHSEHLMITTWYTQGPHSTRVRLNSGYVWWSEPGDPWHLLEVIPFAINQRGYSVRLADSQKHLTDARHRNRVRQATHEQLG